MANRPLKVVKVFNFGKYYMDSREEALIRKIQRLYDELAQARKDLMLYRREKSLPGDEIYRKEGAKIVGYGSKQD
jgi:hypothetical protein